MVSIIIPHFNTPELLLQCLKSIAEHTPEDIQVCITDDCSDVDVRMEIMRWSVHRMLPDLYRSGIGTLRQLYERQGFTKAVNTWLSNSELPGLPFSSDHHAVILNSDITVEEGWLTALLAALDLDPRIGIVSSQVRDAFDHNYVQMGGATAPGKHRSGYADKGELQELRIDGDDYLAFACVLLRGEMVRELGPLDEGFAIYSSDNDYCYRAQAAGWKLCYQPSSIVYHECGATTRQVEHDTQFQRWIRDDAIHLQEKWPEHAALMEGVR